jgi:ribosomal 50S subunit-associated protein YjgA (DUF615 family)
MNTDYTALIERLEGWRLPLLDEAASALRELVAELDDARNEIKELAAQLARVEGR